ncbi:uncharacterized protein LOC117832353 [Notolabrus celidotus]|uniref:uncharacterized protein LOC117832353 n=1 Tax=Notolabrus celidotus TaxID=1203425 RepID=UPI00148FDFD4|nr:uncharacterized protein LOC117832353 [Notolabrus celidotus]
MGAKHARASLADPQSCSHCESMSEKILERRPRVAVANRQDPCLSGATPKASTHQPRAEMDWATIMETDSPVMPPLFEELLDLERGEEDAEGGANSDLLDLNEMVDEEDDSTFPTQHSRPPSASDAAPQVDSSLYEVCKRAAEKLGIQWPAAEDAEGAERDLYDGKRLPPAQPAAKQLLPPVPACMKEMSRYWSSPFKSKLPAKGYSELEIKGMGELGLAEPPKVEPSVAFHLHPDRCSVSASSSISLPGKTERLTASVLQRMYRYAAQSVCSLNAQTLLSAYQAEMLEEMGRQLDSGAPNPVLWDEICVVNDLILRSSRGEVQGCGHVMGLAVAGSFRPSAGINEGNQYPQEAGRRSLQPLPAQETSPSPRSGSEGWLCCFCSSKGETNGGYFLVPKKGSTSLRPILDLRVLNKHLQKYTFRMLTHKVLCRSIRPGDWFVTIDLTDAYFNIAIYPSHRRFLKFAYQGKAYEYQVIPFGLALAPRVFTKCVEAALSLRSSSIRIFSYIDDYLICSHSREQAIRDSAVVTGHLRNLGFNINWGKSRLQPSQYTEYLGLSINSLSYRVTLSEGRLMSLMHCLSLFEWGKVISFRLCLRLLGLMASVISVVPLRLLMMRDFQRWVSALRLCPRRHLSHRVKVTPTCLAALRPWRDAAALASDVALGTVSSRVTMTTDAYLSGWGATLSDRTVNGTWSPRLAQAHINVLELWAVFLALQHFLQFIQGHHVLVKTDNSTMVAYINRQGGTRSLQLHTLARKIIMWSSTRLLSLLSLATHLPGVLNRGADLLSRGNPLYGERTLHPQVVEQIWQRYGRAAVDLFASRENAQCPLYFSLSEVNASLGMDALAHPWPDVLLYAFPPLSLISPTLARVRQQSLSLILIAPQWTLKHWVAEITQILADEPWPLPIRRDILTQAHGEIYHPHPDRIALWAWPVRGGT